MTRPIQGIIHQLRKAVLVHDGAGLTDGQLLTLFIDRRDEGAFEALVKRHGPMVLGVCRRLLRNPHDAEDAFQATFLVLVRKAASVVPRDMVANWLYGVARTTALRANAMAAKKRRREKQVRTMPEPEATPPDCWQDVRPVLDQELSRLPDKYRVAILLCDVEGKSHKEAARRLGWPQGTVSGRLVRGRKMLANRLTRRGLSVPIAALAAGLAQDGASASMSASLVAATIKAASLLAAGQAVGVGLISVQAAALTEGVVMTMLVNKLKAVTLALTLATLVGGAGLLYRTQAAEPAADTPPPAVRQTAKEEPIPDPIAEPGSSEQDSRKLLPSSPWPRPALVHLQKSSLVVRTLEVMVEPMAVQFHGQTATSYERMEILRTSQYPLEMVKVYDATGKSISRKELPQLLEKETVALVSNHGEAVDPLNLRLFKEGTLLFILPLPAPPAAAVAVPPPPVPYFAPPSPPVPAPVEAPPPVAEPPDASSRSAAIPSPIAFVRVAPDVVELHERTFSIPVHVQPDRRATLRQLFLFASTDQGKTWAQVAAISPDADRFVFHASMDGLYWFMVQTLGWDGRFDPRDLTGNVPPRFKVLVNTGSHR
ncbi:MAG TPA: RNA polymerase sigma factor [Gemmataceae bacterium]|nr:RNA polymerase sigma factor [Gemmataceae bacterium]